MKWFLIYLAIINVVTYVVYGYDKQRAKRDEWRVPEKTLLGLAVIGGSIGAFFGMHAFRHKIKKPKFFVGLPVIIILQIVIIYSLFFYK